uniref:Transposable element P transposase-like RNase H domain-containing protein n=1 Tax=Strigamia maritima TaxID=126957 RepID=T1IRB6_STRMM
MKLTLKAAARIAKTKSSNGKKYEADWCLLLKIKSPKAYRHLRDNNLLSLPHPSTIQRLVTALSCQFGFNSLIFDQMKKEFARKEKPDKQVMILLDEMKVKSALHFDKIKLEFHGFVDFGEYTEDYFEKTSKKEVLADHALVCSLLVPLPHMVQLVTIRYSGKLPSDNNLEIPNKSLTATRDSEVPD